MEMIKLTRTCKVYGTADIYIAKHAIVSIREIREGTEIFTNAICNGGGCAIENLSYIVKETAEEICNMIG